MKLAPIALFVYSRLETLKYTVESLKKNDLAPESELFIFSDGPKPGAESKVSAVRSYINTISGFKNIVINESPYNKGLANSIIAGVSEIVKKYGKIIVVEDDLITSPNFLKYMNDSLNLYEAEDSVACICAYVYPISFPKDTHSFFIRGADCWGWATWRRSWQLFECDSEKLLTIIKSRHLEKTIDFDWSYPYVDMLKDQIAGKVDSWAIRWYVSAVINNKLCLYPTKSLVRNIGFDGEGTHCGVGENKNLNVLIDMDTRSWEKIPVEEKLEFLQLFEHHLAKLSHYRFRKLFKYLGLIEKIILKKYPKFKQIIERIKKL